MSEHTEHLTAWVKPSWSNIGGNESYGHVTITLVSYEYGEVRGLSTYGPHAHLSGFRIACQWNSGYAERDFTPYGFSAGFKDVDLFTADSAQAYAKTLARIERGMAKLSQDLGYVADGDFAAWALRVLHVLGVKAIVRKTADSPDYRPEYQELEPHALSWIVRDAIAAHRKHEGMELVAA